MEWFIILLTFIGIQLVVRAFFMIIERQKYKEYKKTAKNNKIEIKITKYAIVIGIIDVLFCLSPFLINYLLPSISTGFDLWVQILFIAFAFLGIAIVYTTITKKATVFMDKDFFLERNIFGQTKMIYYKNIEEYQIIKNCYLVLYVKKPNKKIKKQTYDMRILVNINALMYLFSKNGVKKKK